MNPLHASSKDIIHIPSEKPNQHLETSVFNALIKNEKCDIIEFIKDDKELVKEFLLFSVKHNHNKYIIKSLDSCDKDPGLSYNIIEIFLDCSIFNKTCADIVLNHSNFVKILAFGKLEEIINRQHINIDGLKYLLTYPFFQDVFTTKCMNFLANVFTLEQLIDIFNHIDPINLNLFRIMKVSNSVNVIPEDEMYVNNVFIALKKCNTFIITNTTVQTIHYFLTTKNLPIITDIIEHDDFLKIISNDYTLTLDEIKSKNKRLIRFLKEEKYSLSKMFKYYPFRYINDVRMLFNAIGIHSIKINNVGSIFFDKNEKEICDTIITEKIFRFQKFISLATKFLVDNNIKSFSVDDY